MQGGPILSKVKGWYAVSEYRICNLLCTSDSERIYTRVVHVAKMETYFMRFWFCEGEGLVNVQDEDSLELQHSCLLTMKTVYRNIAFMLARHQGHSFD